MCSGGTQISQIIRADMLLSQWHKEQSVQELCWKAACRRGQDLQLQSQATRLASAANSKRTAPQWQPPLCVTKRSFPIGVCVHKAIRTLL